jgi:hypothetical protein
MDERFAAKRTIANAAAVSAAVFSRVGGGNSRIGSRVCREIIMVEVLTEEMYGSD